ncbi:Uncharacterised protein [Mycoplasmopsis californica]|uniref:Transmembrane protein n=1 Tax=Mycoplasmopsis equigenitalium TaxID=114883 RepID=A0ABY5J213_9BACT|nr:hypothetical protein [Mycoplasmopsis equigenitalium]UUD37035.1 hypothetical protein NPA09_00455 [Mycoplasmopsis equigenitalium]VEU69665.1 Uncharacterised protein [Mycoplasmopsis californica]
MKMKKYLKIIVPLLVGTSSFTLSFSPNAAVAQNSARTNQISPQFDTFEAKAKTEIEKAIKNSVDKILIFLDAELAKLKDLNAQADEEYIKKLERKIHLTTLKSFFTDNKSDIISNYQKYGFKVIFPYIISKEKKYSNGKIKYDGETYTDIKIGNSTSLDYSEVLDKDKDLLLREKQEDNFLSNEKFVKLIQKYAADLEKEIIEIIFSQNDILKIGKDIFFVEKEFNNPSTPGVKINSFSITTPQGYASWNEYFIKKITNRYVHFDLRQNQDSYEQEEEPQPQPSTPPNVPPIVPNKPPVDPKTNDPKQIPESILSLEPYVSYKYSNIAPKDLKSLFDSLSVDKKTDFFFFINPINTRFDYVVESINVKGEKLILSIKITDKSKPELSRKYLIEKTNFSYVNNKAVHFLLKKQNDNLAKKFGLLYKSLGLDENINYPLLANDSLQSALFDMVNLATAMVNDQKFTEKWNAIVAKYAKDNLSYEDNDSSLINSSNEVFDTLINGLSHSKINEEPFWNSLINAFEIIKNDLKAIAAFEANKQAVNEKFNQHNLSTTVIDKLFNILDLSILRLKAVSRDWTKNFNLEDWFNEYTQKIKDVKEHFDILKVLLIPNKVQANSQEHTDLLNSYKMANEKISKYKTSENNLKITLAAIFITFGLISLLASLSVYLLKRRKNTKLIFIILTIVSTIVSLIGVILLILGLKG